MTSLWLANFPGDTPGKGQPFDCSNTCACRTLFSVSTVVGSKIEEFFGGLTLRTFRSFVDGVPVGSDVVEVTFGSTPS